MEELANCVEMVKKHKNRNYTFMHDILLEFVKFSHRVDQH